MCFNLGVNNDMWKYDIVAKSWFWMAGNNTIGILLFNLVSYRKK